MASLKTTDLNSPSNRALQWPRQLRTPAELVQSLRQKTKLCLIRSPIYSKIVLQVVGAWAYLVSRVFNTTRVYNIETFNKEMKHLEEAQQNFLEFQDHSNQIKPKAELQVPNSPLITLSNHISCIDDPILWGTLLPLTYYSTNPNTVRWSAAAVEICFSKPWHSAFFSLGKTFPIVRGLGIDQPAMEFAGALLRYNQWLHMFPEGKVMRDKNQKEISNKERGYIFKWGIAKLILDYFENSSNSDRNLRILPFYHLGLDEILPIGWPYIPRFGKRITVFIKPTVIEMNVKRLNEILANKTLNSESIRSRSNDEIQRIKLTNFLEEEVEKLIEPAKNLHKTR